MCVGRKGRRLRRGMLDPGRQVLVVTRSIWIRDGLGEVIEDELGHPRVFFAEALRVLKPGGRLAMIEPGITPVSWLFYNYLHEEPVDMSADPLGQVEATPDPTKDPFDSNQGIPTLLFKRQEHRIAFAEAFPGFTLIDRQWLSLFAYPLTGGFKSWSLLSAQAAEGLIRLEQVLMPFIGPILAFRLMVVLEKRKPKQS